MPEYTFRCRKCKKEWTYILGMEEKRPTKCEARIPQVITGDIEWIDENDVPRVVPNAPEFYYCNGELARIFGIPNVVYRAGGFQTTDKRLDKKEGDDDE